MADSKITALASIGTGTDPANDPLVIVDVSDILPGGMSLTGTTKKVTLNNLLACSPIATLASATISGAATVGTTLGVTGVSTFSAGTALLPALTTTGDTNTGIYYPAADTFAVTTGGTERYRVDSAGNCGIGVTPSASWTGGAVIQQQNGAVYANSSLGSYDFSYNSIRTASNSYVYAASSLAAARFQLRDGAFNFFTAPSSGVGGAGTAITFTQAMTLSASGQLLLGTSSTSGGVDIGMVMNKPSATGFVGNAYQLNGVDKAFAYIASAASAYTTETVSGYIIRAVSATNGVYLPNGGTSWLALSDERFKDIIEPISNAVAKVGSLRSVIGKFKTESEGTRRSFLIAQDVQAVLPEAVDASNPDQLGVAYTEVIPLLVAAINELTARVQTLEAK